MFYSYVMGIDTSIYNLEKDGFIIEPDGNNYKVSFKGDKAGKWEKFICKHLQIDYWNEFLTDNGISFS